MSSDIKLDKLREENEQYKTKIKELETQLQQYTNNERHKKYYEKNKDVVKEKAKNYLSKIKEENLDKLKEWRHNAYLKRKEKLKNNNANEFNN